MALYLVIRHHIFWGKKNSVYLDPIKTGECLIPEMHTGYNVVYFK